MKWKRESISSGRNSMNKHMEDRTERQVFRKTRQLNLVVGNSQK